MGPVGIEPATRGLEGIRTQTLTTSTCASCIDQLLRVHFWTAALHRFAPRAAPRTGVDSAPVRGSNPLVAIARPMQRAFGRTITQGLLREANPAASW